MKTFSGYSKADLGDSYILLAGGGLKDLSELVDTTTALTVSGVKTFNSKIVGNIDTANSWKTARTLTIGSTGKSVDGSADVSWTLSEIGAAASGHNHNSAYLRKNTNDSSSYQYEFTKTNDHAIKVGTIRGRAVGDRTGDYIHLYERVHIGSPNGWGSSEAPSYGLSTYGSAWLAASNGSVGIGTTSPETKLDLNGVQQIYQRGNDNTAFKNLLLLKLQNSTETSEDTFGASSPSFGIGFRRYWTSGSSPYGETTCAGIYSFVTSSWRGGLVFRTKLNTTLGGTHDVSALILHPSGAATFNSGITVSGSQTLYGLTSTCNYSNSASYSYAAMQIREYNFGGAQSDTWGNAPRLAWHWGGRVLALIGLASNNHLYISEDNFSSSYRIVMETGTWGINITGNADTVDGEHSNAFAHIGAHNNLTASGNEFTFASSGFSGTMYINYRTAGGLNGNITDYLLCNGAGGNLGYIIHTGNIGSQSVNYANSAAYATKAKYIEGDNDAAYPGGALLRSGSGRADASPSGDTWIFWDTLGGTSSYWGIRHNLADNSIGICGQGGQNIRLGMYSGVSSYFLSSVGIGTSSPGYTLHVDGSTYLGKTTLDNTPFTDSVLILANNSNESPNDSITATNASHGITFVRDWSSYGYRCKAAGIYMVGSYNWLGGLVFRTKLNTNSNGGTHDTNALLLVPNGRAYFVNNVYAPNYYTTSDRLKKQNISSLSEHIRKFQLKDTEKWHYGVIAQEVEEIFRDGEEGNMTVNYTSILSYYIGQLENKVASLEKELNNLKQKFK